MTPLPLDDPRWGELEIGDGRSADVPGKLQYLLDNPSDGDAFTTLWPDMCSQDTAWSISYAAVPYIVEIASRLSPGERWEHLFFVGYVVMCSSEEVPEDLPNRWVGNRTLAKNSYLKDAYVAALQRALPLAIETLAFPLEPGAARYMLAAVAALKAFPNMGKAISDLDIVLDELEMKGIEWPKIEG